jgi:hypothetical protein
VSEELTQASKTAFRALVRSDRVRFVTGIGVVFHLLSTLLLLRSRNATQVPEFVYFLGFVPIVILATVTQANTFGTDRGATLTAFCSPIAPERYCRGRAAAAVAWSLTTLAPGWLLGLAFARSRFAPVLLLEFAVMLVLAVAGEMLAVLAPSSRSYTRMVGQTMSLSVQVPFNLVSLAAIVAASRFLAGSAGHRAVIAAACTALALLLWLVAQPMAGRLFRARREAILNVLRLVP